MKNTKKKTILVICRGNIIRSPFAEAVINSELVKHGQDNEFVAISRGIQGTLYDPVPVKFPNITFYKNEYFFSKPALVKFNVDITKHVSKPVNKKVAEQACVIFAVDEKTKIELLKLFPDIYNKIYKLSELTDGNGDFTDPETVTGFEKHFEILSGIYNTIAEGYPKLLALANTPEKN